MKKLLLSIYLIAATALPNQVRAQDSETLAASARKELQQALDELAAGRAEIEAEKVPLSREVNQLERKLLEARQELQRRQRFQDNQLVELNALKGEVRARGEEVKYVEALLGEYSRSFRTRLNILEASAFEKRLAPIDAAAASSELSATERLAKKLELARISLERVRNVAGGHSTEATAAGPDGRILQGKGVILGPVALFVSANGEAAGLVQQELNKADPSVVSLGGKSDEAIRQFVSSGSGEVPIDPTLGNALKIASTKEGVVEHFLKGGVVMWPILLLAAAAVAVALAKWLQLAKVRLATDGDLQEVLELLKKGDASGALVRAKQVKGPAGHLLASAVEHSDEKKEYIEEVLYERMLNAKPRLESLLPFIALTAAAAPLLGLLGTVTGMISTFNMISLFGTGDPRTLSSGISEALITTEYGLYVAIPAVMAHAFLSRRVKAILANMEQTAIGFVNGVPTEEPEPWRRS